MKIKRYVARETREALRLIREELGPDAVILSNRAAGDGVEVIAATDYDASLLGPGEPATVRAAAGPAAGGATAGAPTPSYADVYRQVAEGGLWPDAEADDLAPGPEAAGESAVSVPLEEPGGRGDAGADETPALRDEMAALRELLECQLASLAWNDDVRQKPHRARALRQLSQIGIAPDVARAIADEMPGIANPRDAWRVPLNLLAHKIPLLDDRTLEEGGVIALVGPTGVGKTTTIAKLAARFILRHDASELGLVTTDGYRIGAREQLLTFARILGVPMHVAGSARELRSVLRDLASKRLVLIDTAGMSQRDVRLAGQFSTLAGAERLCVLLALSASAEQESLREVVEVFGRTRPYAAVLTKLDEATSLGPALSASIAAGLPIAWLADGQRVPEDLHPAHSRRSWLVQQAVGLAKARPRAIDEDYLAREFGRREVVHA
jgi:flagellar biosynthesis protein FlhF